MTAMDEHVVMANPATGDVVVVTKREFERVWSRADVTDSRGQVVIENPWVLASSPEAADIEVTKEKLLAAARDAGVKLADVDSDDPDEVISEITAAAAHSFGHPVDDTPNDPGV